MKFASLVDQHSVKNPTKHYCGSFWSRSLHRPLRFSPILRYVDGKARVGRSNRPGGVHEKRHVRSLAATHVLGPAGRKNVGDFPASSVVALEEQVDIKKGLGVTAAKVLPSDCKRRRSSTVWADSADVAYAERLLVCVGNSHRPIFWDSHL